MLTVRRSKQKDGIEEVPSERVPSLLKNPNETLWFDIDSPSEQELELFARELGVHPLTIEDIVKQNQRPKIESFENYLYLAVHPLVKKNGIQLEPIEVDLLIGKNWLVFAHYGTVPGVIEDGRLNERLQVGFPRGVDFLLYSILDLIVDSYFPVVDQIEEEVDRMEDRILGKARPKDITRLITLRHSLVHVRKAVSPQREIFNQLTRHDLPYIRPECALYFRDVYDHLIRITEELDGLRDLLAGDMEVHLSVVSNQLNVIMKRLAAWGTIFGVITAIAGIYGMNFKFMPELEWPYAYPIVLAVMVAVSFGLYLFFKQKDYL